MSYPRWDQATGPVKCCHCKKPIAPGEDIWIKSKGIYYCAGDGLLKEASSDEIKPDGLEEAVIRDLDKLGDRAAETSMAKSALYLAKQLDDGEVAPREVTQYSKEIRLMIMQLYDLYPPADDQDDTETRRDRFQERRRREQGGI